MKSAKVYLVLSFKSSLHSSTSHQVRFLTLSALFSGLIGRYIIVRRQLFTQRIELLTTEIELHDL